jgi:hypothetical protein
MGYHFTSLQSFAGRIGYAFTHILILAAGLLSAFGCINWFTVQSTAWFPVSIFQFSSVTLESAIA